MFYELLQYPADHNLRLLALALLVGMAGTASALAMLRRAQHSTGFIRYLWLCGAAVIFGLGDWSFHYIAMLAYQPGFSFGFIPALTIISLVVAMIGALPAFAVLIGGRRKAWRTILAGALLGGAGGAMYFTSMRGVLAPGIFVYSEPRLAVSVLFGMLFSIAALALRRFRIAPLNELAASALLVCGIISQHFLGMTAVSILPLDIPRQASFVLDQTSFATFIAATSMTITIMLGFAGTQFDSHMHRLLAREARRATRLADAAFEGLLVHRDGIILSVNRAMADLLGYSERELTGKSFAAFAMPANQERLTASLLAPIAPTSARPEEFTLQPVDGRAPVIEMMSRNFEHEGRPATIVAIRDITERKLAERRIEHLAHHDTLTGLANRLLFSDRLNQALALSDRGGNAAALICLDLDKFKPVNDQYGHATGDALLIEVAHRIAGLIRETDTAARMGGDEFAIIQPLAEQPDGAQALALRLQAALEAPFYVDGHQLNIGTSIGIALYPENAAEPASLMRAADEALYRAKQAGRGQHCFYAARPGTTPPQSLEGDLREALAAGHLSLAYQPVFSADSLEITSFEALLRWTHETRGIVPPSRFIPLAEANGMIHDIGDFVLECACREAASWDKKLTISVNLSAVQFNDPLLPERIASILDQSGLPPDRLELEITETMLLGNDDSILTSLRAIHALGVKVALDDFGVGYSSFGYLRRFPFDRLKIDRSFINELCSDDKADAIIASIIHLADDLGLQITAEGVESATQLARLQELGCHQVQGYLLGHPARMAHQAYFIAAE
jgi:diguanylate cyclase (GGDEF)-like protein/PAS domain S-box-containing protein